MRWVVRFSHSVATILVALTLAACPTPYVPPAELGSAATLEVEADGGDGFRFGDTVVEGIGLGPQVSFAASGSVASGPAGLAMSYASSSQDMWFRVVHRSGSHRASCTKYFDEDGFLRVLDCEMNPGEDDSALRPVVFQYLADGTGRTTGGEAIDVRRGEGHGFDLRQGDRAIGGVDNSRRPRRVHLASLSPDVERRVTLVAACLLAMDRFNGI